MLHRLMWPSTTSPLDYPAQNAHLHHAPHGFQFLAKARKMVYTCHQTSSNVYLYKMVYPEAWITANAANLLETHSINIVSATPVFMCYCCAQYVWTTDDLYLFQSDWLAASGWLAPIFPVLSPLATRDSDILVKDVESSVHHELKVPQPIFHFTAPFFKTNW